LVSGIIDTVLAMNCGRERGIGIPSELLAREDVPGRLRRPGVKAPADRGLEATVRSSK